MGTYIDEEKYVSIGHPFDSQYKGYCILSGDRIKRGERVQKLMLRNDPLTPVPGVALWKYSRMLDHVENP